MFTRYPKSYLQDLERQTRSAGPADREGPAWKWYAVPVAVVGVFVWGIAVTVDRSLAPFDAPVAVAQPLVPAADASYFPDRFVNTAADPAAPVDTF